MKRIMTATIIGLLCFSMLSILAPQVKASPSVEPEVVCVPFHGTLLGVPHDAWIGKEIVLKGTAHDPDGDSTLEAYKWDFGDGYSTDWIFGVNPYIIEAKHTYTGTMEDGTPYGAGKYFTAWLYVRDTDGLVSQDSYFIAIRDKTLDVEVNVAIDNGLWWLHKTQTRSSSGGIEYGYWSDMGGYTVSPTSIAVLAFEIHGHVPNGDRSEDPYAETTQRGLNYIFSLCILRSISGPSSSCPYGNPDTNGNGIGIDVTSSRSVYEIGMAMMAIAASSDQNLVALTGPANVVGRTYFDILTDMVDLCSWGQNEAGTGRGGWRYSWNYGDSDNSVTQWPTIGLEAAEANWGIQAPSFVKSELDRWLTYSQSTTGGFGYTTPEPPNPARTGAGLCGLAYVGLSTADARVTRAVNYLDSRWGTSGGDGIWGNYYALYAIMKGCRIFDPPIEYIGSHNWYYDDPDGFARYLVTQQMSDGKWPTSSYGGYVLDSGWAILTLTPTITFGPPVANAGPDVDSHPPEPVSVKFDASGSYHTDPTKAIVLYEWDFESDGTWDYSGTDLKVEHAYPAYTNPDGSIDWSKTAKDYTATLRVTDNNDPPKQDTDTCVVHITAPPWKPVADPDGPYDGLVGVPIQLDGSNSYAPGGVMYPAGHPWYETIEKYEWDLNNDGKFDDSIDVKPSFTWSSIGTYSVGLKVTDSQPSGPDDTIGPLDVDIKYTIVVISAITDNIPPTTYLTVGDPQYIDSSGNMYVTSNTPFSLTAEDNIDGTGVKATAYRIHDESYSYDTGWLAYSVPFYLTSLGDGPYHIGYNSTDNAGNVEPTNTKVVILDNTAPLLTIEIPTVDAALQDGVDFTVSAWDLSAVASVTFSIQCPQGNIISPEFQLMPGTLKSDGKWHLYFDTGSLPDGFYLLAVNGTDVLGNSGVTTVPFSIRNWATIQMLPHTPNSKAGRTMPIKFAIRVAASVDPAQPFIYNEELTIKIYMVSSPSNILLQTSTFGSTSTDYRIQPGSHYITNFKTLGTPATYLVNIYRKDMLIGSFQFSTVK